MAVADTAKLIASLELQDRFSRTADAAIGKVGALESRFGKIGGIAQKGVGTAMTNISRLGFVAAGGIAVAIKGGLDSLAQLESAVTSVDGAIEQMGLTGQLTGQQVAGWANDIERDVGAAFDDKDITQAATTLLRFGQVTPGNLRPALVVMTDLATKTGSVESAATLLAKAMADPTSAAGKLARAGVILTDQQKDQIDALTKAGDAAGAQAVLLDALKTATEGAAAASQGPYQRALSTLADVAEDAKRALAEGFLPVIEKVADWLSTKLADPKVLDDIRGFGQDLAGAFEQILEATKNVPWGSIKDALGLAGQGAKAALDLFTKMPPWVQTAVLTGWGLNKLTGGAVSGIVGELAKGLIKGVLGINAGVVNINAATVNGAGAVPGAAGGTGGRIANAAVTVGGALVIGDQLTRLPDELGSFGNAINTLTTGDLPAASSAIDDFIGLLKNNPLTPFAGVIPEFTVAPASLDALASHIASERAENNAALATTVTQTSATVTQQIASFAASERADNNAAYSLLGSIATNTDAALGKLDANADGTTRMKEVTANLLGISVQKLDALKQQAGGDTAILAGKLGITVEQLAAIRGQATSIATLSQTGNTILKNKEFSPTIKVTSNFNVSARQLVSATRDYIVRAGGVIVE